MLLFLDTCLYLFLYFLVHLYSFELLIIICSISVLEYYLMRSCMGAIFLKLIDCLFVSLATFMARRFGLWGLVFGVFLGFRDCQCFNSHYSDSKTKKTHCQYYHHYLSPAAQQISYYQQPLEY